MVEEIDASEEPVGRVHTRASLQIHSHLIMGMPAGSCMSGHVHVRLCEKGEMALLYPTLVSDGVCSFSSRGVCQYDLNEVRSFASDIRSASLCMRVPLCSLHYRPDLSDLSHQSKPKPYFVSPNYSSQSVKSWSVCGVGPYK